MAKPTHAPHPSSANDVRRTVGVKPASGHASGMSSSQWAVLAEPNGRIHAFEIVDENTKVKGLGVFNPTASLSGVEMGDEVHIGQKTLIRLPPRLPELNAGMVRRAQTISPKDAGFIVARLGIGPGDRVLEAGIGSGALSLHIARVLGDSGHHVTVEPRPEHAEVAHINLERARGSWPSTPRHDHVEGCIEEVTEQLGAFSEAYDAVVLDLPDHPPAVEAVAPLMAVGARLVCYCPVTQQLERAWDACEAAGLAVEWAGELMEREWGQASKGGVRPVNGPFGHTAFLLVAQRR
jgi:tRNA (adenine57-N1/adenine58-N1)-methyltransferase